MQMYIFISEVYNRISLVLGPLPQLFNDTSRKARVLFMHKEEEVGYEDTIELAIHKRFLIIFLLLLKSQLEPLTAKQLFEVR